MTLFDDDGPPRCWRCNDAKRVWSERVGDYIPCPECAATAAIQQTDGASDANPIWRELADNVLYELALLHAELNPDWAQSSFDAKHPGVTTHMDRDERRRWGAVFRAAAKAGWIEDTGRVVRSERRHGTKITVWRSLIHRQESLWRE